MMLLSPGDSFVRMTNLVPNYERSRHIHKFYDWFGSYIYVTKGVRFIPDVYINYREDTAQEIGVEIAYNSEDLHSRTVYTTKRAEVSGDWVESYVISMLVVQELQETSWWSHINK